MVAIEHSQQSTAIATATTEAEPHEHEPQLEDASPEQTDVAVVVERSCISSSETNTINTTTSNSSSSFAASSSSDTTVPSVIGDMSTKNELESAELAKKHQAAAAAAIAKSSAVSQRGVDITLAQKTNVDATTQELSKKVLKLDLTGKELDEYSLKSPKSPINARLPHQTSLTSSVDVEDRKTLREALYQGIFHRHRRTIFAVGSFLRMLRSRNSQYNTIRSSSEGEDMEEVR